jgi:hypothetical protein
MLITRQFASRLMELMPPFFTLGGQRREKYSSTADPFSIEETILWRPVSMPDLTSSFEGQFDFESEADLTLSQFHFTTPK